MAKIIGNTTATPNPRPDWAQTDASKADYIKNKPELGNMATKDEVAKSDLSADVQTSLGKADTAIQSVAGLATEKFVTDAIEKIPTPDVSGQINTHNTSSNAHSDIRQSIANIKAVSYESQSLTEAQKAQARANIGAGASGFSGNYEDLENKPDIPDALADLTSDATHRTVTDTEKSNWNAAKTHASSTHARTDATKVADSTTNGNILINGTETNVYTHPNSGVTAGTYKSVTVNAQGHITGGTNPTTLAGYGITDAETKGSANSALASAKEYTDSVAAGKSDSSHKHDSLYDAKGSAVTALGSAKDYTDQEIAKLLNNSSDAIDSIYELRDAMEDNADAIEALEAIAAGKASATHSHAISDVTDLQSTLNAKAAQTSLDSHAGNTTVHITAAERTNWGAAYTHSQAAHAPSNAEKNQNAFSNVAVSGQTTVAADSVTDTLTLVAGDNVTITTDASNDKVTIAAKDTVYTHPESHAASMITGLATVATSGKYSDLSGTPTIPTGAAADKGVDTSIAAGSTSTNLPTSKAVAAFVEGKGYKTTDNNTTYSIASGDSNGQIKITPSTGNAYNVDVKGLGTAAYTDSTAYATAAQGTKADNALPKSGGSITGNLSVDGTINGMAVTYDSNAKKFTFS